MGISSKNQGALIAQIRKAFESRADPLNFFVVFCFLPLTWKNLYWTTGSKKSEAKNKRARSGEKRASPRIRVSKEKHKERPGRKRREQTNSGGPNEWIK